jgi:hypothetical protein
MGRIRFSVGLLTLGIGLACGGCDHGRTSAYASHVPEGRRPDSTQPVVQVADVVVPTVVTPATDRLALRARLATHREQALTRLHAYAEAGAFPVNTTQAPTGHFFRDSEGRYCAVANLVHQDGRDDLVDDVVRTQNALVVSDIHDGPLYAWILTSGLTQEELAHIQRPAPMVLRRPVDDLVAAKPAPPTPKLPTVEQMRDSLRAQLAGIEADLRRDTDASLDVAVERLVAATS